jgi:antibiotic biosynthesis monooxygenase (ABM) superfamily enzyme
MKKHMKPRPYAVLTKDARFAGTFEVLVPVPGRNKPHRAAQQFATQKAAEDWIHSPEGSEAIDTIFENASA